MRTFNEINDNLNSIDRLVELIDEITNGGQLIFGVEFEKKDGSRRRMAARLNPDSTDGEELARKMGWNPLERGMIPVREMKSDGGFKMVSVRGPVTLRCGDYEATLNLN
ncbi:hypothetical protein [Salinibacter phage M8CRM-1]|uniref:Uncharacterized protein n=3 Tax=Kryptosalinivirus TaxID=2560163 RepID=A0A2I6UG76_9CAUD|nr:hypothetical protein FGG63_gp58 [Salinibacter phage M8CC-19]YP_009639526.1 hypothetical protein FGG67_gp60 [Salinibacter phage M8CRM-1]AUO78998.1 hypothetical protein [Salinibacter phage M8CC-19]AUO79158.1 hypothetical protein [Salinibacter phage M8CRM-1]